VSLHTCPDCKNQFVQPFTCKTCGAQKLYDETVRSQAATIEQLRAAIDKALEWCYRENVYGHIRNELEIASSAEPQTARTSESE
jgi:hypothetical protein